MGLAYLKMGPLPTDWALLKFTPTLTSPSSVFFGTGYDGLLHCDGTATVTGMKLVGGGQYALQRDIFASSLTVDSGIEVKPAGFRLFVSGTLTLSGSARIDDDGGAGGTSSPGAGRGAAYYAGINAGGDGSTGAPGTSSGSLVSGTGLPAPYFSTRGTTMPGIDGARGQGGGGGGVAGSGGGGGGAVFVFDTFPQPATGGADFVSLLNGSNNSVRFPETAYSWGSGGGGGAGGVNVGGGGGAGGGMCFVAARILSGSGTISASGGNGGNGLTTQNSGGGGGGGGGVVVVVYETNSGVQLVASGGAHGLGHGTGANGGVGGAGQVVKLNLSGDGT